MAQMLANFPTAFRLPQNRLSAVSMLTGGLVVVSGFVCLFVAPFVGSAVFDNLWGVEPLGYIGGILLFFGVSIFAGGLGAAALGLSKRLAAERKGRENRERSRATTGVRPP